VRFGDVDVTVGDQALDLRARELAEHGHEEAIEPLAPFELRGHIELRSRSFTPRLAATPRHGGLGSNAATARRASRWLSGARISEMNCDVEKTSNTIPRGSPRRSR
jgi:hypothetical protein